MQQINQNHDAAQNHGHNLLPIHDVQVGDENNNVLNEAMEQQVNQGAMIPHHNILASYEVNRLLQHAAIQEPVLFAQENTVIGHFDLGAAFNLEELNRDLQGNLFTDDGLQDLFILKQLKTGIAVIRSNGKVTILCYYGQQKAQLEAELLAARVFGHPFATDFEFIVQLN